MTDGDTALFNACVAPPRQYDMGTGARKLTDHIIKQWVNTPRFCNWQDFHTPRGYASSNNPLEQYHRRLKLECDDGKHTPDELITILDRARLAFLNRNVAFCTSPKAPERLVALYRLLSRRKCITIERLPPVGTLDAGLYGAQHIPMNLTATERKLLKNSVKSANARQKQTEGMLATGWVVDTRSKACSCLYYEKHRTCCHLIAGCVHAGVRLAGVSNTHFAIYGLWRTWIQDLLQRHFGGSPFSGEVPLRGAENGGGGDRGVWHERRRARRCPPDILLPAAAPILRPKCVGQGGPFALMMNKTRQHTRDSHTEISNDDSLDTKGPISQQAHADNSAFEPYAGDISEGYAERRDDRLRSEVVADDTCNATPQQHVDDNCPGLSQQPIGAAQYLADEDGDRNEHVANDGIAAADNEHHTLSVRQTCSRMVPSKWYKCRSDRQWYRAVPAIRSTSDPDPDRYGAIISSTLNNSASSDGTIISAHSVHGSGTLKISRASAAGNVGASAAG
ncbi:unnamed protein product [Phytophthora fragariaefolia]|uniref:Unnamed protein product n=1 Tax=Phytophthora fragariaefolia TaxID=1490495 RepID=A0A9W6WV51_9STRA|nr:unnamed protein product [Phytophthora fragariaefolia]